MTFPLEWIFVASLCLYSLWLSARYTEERRLRMVAEAELRVERRMRLKAESEEAEIRYRMREMRG